jgi:PGF-pre-PGF domain-containing protein
LKFDAKKTAGKTTAIVEMLKGKSALVPKLPDGEIYKSVNIWVGNDGFATSKNIENAVICFKVDKAWIQDEGIDQSSVILNLYSDGKWNSLPTSPSGEDEKYLYFIAKTPGFGSFAITGKIIEKQSVCEIQPETQNEDVVQKAGNTDADVEKETEAEEEEKTPGFETVYGIVGLLAVFFYRRK